MPDSSHQCNLCHIDLSGISVSIGGHTLLSDVSMHLHCGQLTVLIGENGAGKTTLVRALLSQINYTGQIRHLDFRGRALPRIRTGYVPQHLDFDREMPVTVQDFLAASMTRVPVWLHITKKIRKKCIEALEKVDAQGLIDAQLGKLSGGELQRVLLALALSPEPDLLILDEPVSGIDQNGLKMFLDIVVSLREKHHMAVLLVSHDMHLVKAYADHVVLLEKKVLAQGTPKEVFASEAFIDTFGREAF